MRRFGSGMLRRGGVWVGLLAGAPVLAVGCGDDSPRRAPAVQVSRAPVQPAPVQTGPLPDVQIDHSPLTLAAPPAGYVVDASAAVPARGAAEPCGRAARGPAVFTYSTGFT